MLAVAFAYAAGGAMLAAVFDRASEVPVFAVVIGCAGTLGFAVPLTVGAGNSPSLQPIRDLAEGTERVAAGDYSQRLPVVQDDDLGALAASFNRMQAAWLSGNDFRGRSGPMSTQRSRRGCSSRVTTCSPVSAAR
jgi:HAMP domain-containing protein